MANIQMQYYNGSSYTVCYPQANLANVTGTLPVANGGTGVTSLSSISLTSLGGTLSIAKGGTGNTTGLAASATKLATSRTIRTNLASTSTASFNGTANVTPGVTGILGVANGGTGVSSLASLATSINGTSYTTVNTSFIIPDDFSGDVKSTATATKIGTYSAKKYTEGWLFTVKITVKHNGASNGGTSWYFWYNDLKIKPCGGLDGYTWFLISGSSYINSNYGFVYHVNKSDSDYTAHTYSFFIVTKMFNTYS